MSYQLRNWIKRLGEHLLEAKSQRGWRQRTKAPRISRPLLEVLEDRVVPSTYVVTNINYSGAGSLGAAITSASAANDVHAVVVFSGIPSNSAIDLNSGNASPITTFGPTAFVVGGSGTNITIEGGSAPGMIINGEGSIRLFAVESGDSLTVANLTLEGGLAQGGNGGSGASGGGGGAGLGGAVFVQAGATLTIQSSTLTGNTAVGGNGGSWSGNNYYGGGGGGGLGGSGGNAYSGTGAHGGAPNGGPSEGGYPVPGGYGGGGAGGNNYYGGAGGGFGGGGGGEGGRFGWGSYGGGGFGGGGGGAFSVGPGGGGGGGGSFAFPGTQFTSYTDGVQAGNGQVSITPLHCP
jgi:hypothetical protein